MSTLKPSEIIEGYGNVGSNKTTYPVWKLLLMGMLAGFIIGGAAATSNTATHAVTNVSLGKIISGLLFPFGLGIVMLLGAELFTGNCMIPISVLERKASIPGMLKNWVLVYTGNFIGSILLAAAIVYCGQLDYSAGGLAVYTIKLAASKCSLGFGAAVISGILCNLFVCAGVLCSLSAKDTTGRILGAYAPVIFFVVCGFEHCVANMYYIPAGVLALRIPEYAQLAAEAGLNTAALTWKSFFLSNLLPVTMGNILGGAALGIVLWFCHGSKKQSVIKT